MEMRGRYHKAGYYTKRCAECGGMMEFRYYCIARVRKFCSLGCTSLSRSKGGWGDQFGEKRAWTAGEDAALRVSYEVGDTLDEICEKLVRTRCEVRGRARKLGIVRLSASLHKLYVRAGMKNKGRERPDLALLNREKNVSGPDNPFYGKRHTAEARRRMSEIAKERGDDLDYHRKRMEGMRRNRKGKYECPNSYERRLGGVLDSLFLGEYKFVGDWTFVIARKNPDFVSVNGQKKIIELFGEVYHDPKSSPWRIKEGRAVEERVELFREHGYETLIVWCKELGDMSKLEAKLRGFHAGRGH